MNQEERSAFRAFVREHHPDRGGDPDAFVAGLARFGAGGQPASDGAPADDLGSDPAGPADCDDPADARYDAPVEVVTPLPFPVRVGVALIRTWHRRRNHRVQ